ncbi:MAG: tetratricopeptide repeat protein [Chitinispirillaceae bacterium]|jgi:Tfp pilus assembly protein PilF
MNNGKQLPASCDIRRILSCYGIIACITLIAFLPSLNNGFTYWDDDTFVVNNPDIQGFTLKNLTKIFTSNYVGNYQPLTMLTYMAEFHFFRFNPIAYHSTNLILHILNGLLVCTLIFGLSGHYLTGLLVGLLFAVHPLRVESVAWIAERKDVLFAFFYFFSLLFYIWHIRGKRGRFYWLCMFSLLFSLLSKPMAVTQPFVLLLIDYLYNKRLDKKTLLGKVPFFAIVMIFSIITFLTQKQTGDISEYLRLSMLQRICVPFYNLFFYMAKTVAPVRLCSLYPLPPHLSDATMFGFFAAPFIVTGGAVAVYCFRRYSRTLVFGSLFYFITLLPVLQIAPFGNVLVAERYSYIPLVGIYFVFAVLCRFLLKEKLNSTLLKSILAIVTSVSIVVFAWITHQRCDVWKDGLSLWNDVIAKYPIAVAYNYRGNIYTMHRDFDRAIEDFNLAINRSPKYCQAYDSRGFAYSAKGDFDRAIEDHTVAIGLDPMDALAYTDRGIAYKSKGEYGRAIDDFTHAIKLKPMYAIYNNRGVTWNALGDYNRAIEDFNEAARLNPHYSHAYYNRGLAYKATGDYSHALDDFKKACDLGYDPACQMLSKN